MGEVIVVTSGKGGVGKTTTTANLGSALALRGKKVVLIDTDIGLRNLDVVMGLENRIVYDIVDVVEEKCKLKQALIKDKRFKDLFLLPAAQTRDKSAVNEEQMKELTEKLKEEFDYIIIDAPAGVESNTMLAATQADRAVIVATPDYASVRGADVLDMKLREAGIDERYYVINKVKAQMMDAEGVPSFGEIGMMIRSKVIGVIPYDDNIDFSVSLGTPAASDSRNIMKDIFIKIARRIIKQ